jgi:DNA sulfur modification protein DndD
MSEHANTIVLIKELEAELDDVARQLKGSPLEEISQLEKQRQEFQADIDDYNVDIGSLDERINNFTEEIAELKNEASKARKAEERERILSKKLDMAQRAADAVEEIYEVFADQMRQKIEEKTQEIFKLLVWKDSHFQKVSLDSDYRLEVIDRYDLPARPELSAGERQILSLSFITAMSQVTEEEAPIVMDTPFGRLSSYHRSSITRHLPELADQLVLFVTDEELHSEAHQNLLPFIGAEYRLEFDPETSCTQIIEVS